MKQIITNDGISFELNKNNTAHICYSPNARGNIIIQKSVVYQNQEYLIKTIQESAFKNNHSIRSIKFSDDSTLFSIQSKSFYNSSIEFIGIPSSVENLEEGWISNAQCLKSITISSKNENFKYADEKHQIIIGKSDKNSEDYDVLVFANRDIETATIPASIKRIASFAFENCKHLIQLTIQDNSKLQTIRKRAFSFTSIEKITIPKSVEIIEESAFIYCESLKEVLIEKGSKLKSISNSLFFNCSSLEKVEIPENSELKSIGKNVFFNSSIKSIYIPSFVENLEDGWISNAQCLKSIKISSNNKNFKYEDEEHQIIIGKSDKNSEDFDVLVFANRNIKNIKIPYYIKHISSFAFGNCRKLTKIEIPENSNLQSIGKCAFSKTLIETINFTTNVETLDDDWCNNANLLKTLTISPNNKNFKYLDKTHQIIIGKSDKNSEDYDVLVFANRDIETATIPASIKRIASFAFENCKHLIQLTIQDNSKLQTIRKRAFSFTSIEKITIPKSVEIIEESVFIYCKSLKEVLIEKGSKLKSISNSLFFNCYSLEKVEIPENSELKSICFDSFSFSSIKNLYIPSTVELLDKEWCSFTNCLKNVEISPNNQNFKFCDAEKKIIAGKSDKNSDDFDVIVFVNRDIENAKIPAFIKYISSYSFYNCTKLKTIEFAENSELLSIEAESFCYSSIETIEFPSKLETLEDGWNMEMENLKEVKVSPDNQNIKISDENNQIILGKSDKNSDVFDVIVYASHDIKNVIIPSYIKYIFSYAFESCESLQVVEFQKGSQLRKIGCCAFYSSMIKTITIPASVEIIEYEAFKYCFNLKSFIIEKGSKLKSIPFSLFHGTFNLKKVQIPEESSLQTIEEDAFMQSSVNEIYIPSSVKKIDKNWCKFTGHLHNVTVSPNNKYFKYADKEHRMIAGKSNNDVENYNVLVFADQSIKKMIIPENISIINISFDNNMNLVFLDFLGEVLLSNCGFLNNCRSILIVSFPDLHKINIGQMNVNDLNPRFTLYIAANSKII